MFAKMVLPVLGGSPSVWAVALCFFQGALLAGYCYAHLVIRLLGARNSGLIHLVVCILAFVVLPIGLPASWIEPPPGEPYLWQLGLFTVGVGLPFFAVAANAPLLQAWFAATGHPHGRDPYFLYAASNLGSLIALLSYPLLLEPAFGLKALSGIWTIGFVVLVALLVVSFIAVRNGTRRDRRSNRRRKRRDHRTAGADVAGAIGLGRPGARPVGAADRLHHARHHRCRLGAAAVGAPARALSPDVRARVPRAHDHSDAAASRGASRLGHPRPARALTDNPRELVHHRRHRRRGVLHVGNGCASHTLRSPAQSSAPDGVLSLDVAWRRPWRALRRAHRTQDLFRSVRVSAAARPLDGLPTARARRFSEKSRRTAGHVAAHRHRHPCPHLGTVGCHLLRVRFPPLRIDRGVGRAVRIGHPRLLEIPRRDSS